MLYINSIQLCLEKFTILNASSIQIKHKYAENLRFID